MNIKELIETRKSIFPKDYSGEEIPQKILEEIMLYAPMVPNHKRTHPCRFQLFTQEKKYLLGKELQKIYKEQTTENHFLEKKYQDILFKFEKSGAVISIVVNFSGIVPEWEEIAAVSMAVQNMYLLCTEYNLACYWSSPKIVDFMGDFLQLENNQKCLGFFYIGMKKP